MFPIRTYIFVGAAVCIASCIAFCIALIFAETFDGVSPLKRSPHQVQVSCKDTLSLWIHMQRTTNGDKKLRGKLYWNVFHPSFILEVSEDLKMETHWSTNFGNTNESLKCALEIRSRSFHCVFDRYSPRSTNLMHRIWLVSAWWNFAIDRSIIIFNFAVNWSSLLIHFKRLYEFAFTL